MNANETPTFEDFVDLAIRLMRDRSTLIAWQEEALITAIASAMYFVEHKTTWWDTGEGVIKSMAYWLATKADFTPDNLTIADLLTQWYAP